MSCGAKGLPTHRSAGRHIFGTHRSVRLTKAASVTRHRSVRVRSGMSEDPQNFAYTHLWVSADGETHITEAKLTGFDLKKYAADSESQFVKQGPSPGKVVFTELAPGLENDYHPAPQVQFVITVAGKWKIKATDGSEKVFVAGDILFQDDTDKSPAKKVPKHWSGVVGDEPNQQVIIQVDRKPEVDNPGPGTL